MTYSLVYATCGGMSFGADCGPPDHRHEGPDADYYVLGGPPVVSVPIDARSMGEALAARRMLAWELGLPEREIRIEEEGDGGDDGRFVGDDGEEVNAWSPWEAPREGV